MSLVENRGIGGWQFWPCVSWPPCTLRWPCVVMAIWCLVAILDLEGRHTVTLLRSSSCQISVFSHMITLRLAATFVSWHWRKGKCLRSGVGVDCFTSPSCVSRPSRCCGSRGSSRKKHVLTWRRNSSRRVTVLCHSAILCHMAILCLPTMAAAGVVELAVRYVAGVVAAIDDRVEDSARGTGHGVRVAVGAHDEARAVCGIWVDAICLIFAKTVQVWKQQEEKVDCERNVWLVLRWNEKN